MLKPFTVWITAKCRNSEGGGNIRPPYLPPAKPVYRSRNNSWNWTWNNRLVPNWERSTSRLYTVTLLILTYMQSTSCEMLGWMKHKLELEKSEKPEIKLSTSIGSWKKQRNSRKTPTSASLTALELWLCGSQQAVENYLRDGNIRPPYLPPAKPVYRSRSNS